MEVVSASKISGDHKYKSAIGIRSNTKGYDTMNKASTSFVTVEDADEVATVKTPKKMRGEVEKKKMLVLDKAWSFKRA